MRIVRQCGAGRIEYPLRKERPRAMASSMPAWKKARNRLVHESGVEPLTGSPRGERLDWHPRLPLSTFASARGRFALPSPTDSKGLT